MNTLDNFDTEQDDVNDFVPAELENCEDRRGRRRHRRR